MEWEARWEPGHNRTQAGMALFPAVPAAGFSPQKPRLWAQGRQRGLCLVPRWVSPFPSLSFGREEAQSVRLPRGGALVVSWNKGSVWQEAIPWPGCLYPKKLREREGAGSPGMHREDPHLLWVRNSIPAWCQQSRWGQELNR